MKIRKAEKKDLKKISEIFKIEYAKKPYNEKWGSKAIVKIKDYFSRNFIFVIEDSKKIAGFVIASPYLWHDGVRCAIDEIVVSSEYQGKGYGIKLLDYLEDFAGKRGIKAITLFSATKSKAFKFYKKRGFKEEDFVSMIKKI